MRAKQLLRILEAEKAEFFTDFGKSITPTDAKTGKPKPEFRLSRYSVWGTVRGKQEVIDQGDDLDKLKKKYGDLSVVKIGGK